MVRSTHGGEVIAASPGERYACQQCPLDLLPQHARGAGLETWNASEIKTFKIPDKLLQ